MSTTRPLRGSSVGTRPSWSSRLAISDGGALLGPGELGVRVQVAAYLDQDVRLRVDTGEHLLEQVGMVDWGSGGHNGQQYRPDRSTVAG